MKIKIHNEELNPNLSPIINEAAKLIEANQKEVSIDKEIVSVEKTKGEILASILITLATSIASDVIAFLIIEAIKRHFYDSKKSIQIKKIKNKNTDSIDIKIEESDSELTVYIEE